jgi:hypothetical protein
VGDEPTESSIIEIIDSMGYAGLGCLNALFPGHERSVFMLTFGLVNSRILVERKDGQFAVHPEWPR